MRTTLLLHRLDGTVAVHCCGCRKLYHPSAGILAARARDANRGLGVSFLCDPCGKAADAQMKRLERTRG